MHEIEDDKVKFDTEKRDTMAPQGGIFGEEAEHSESLCCRYAEVVADALWEWHASELPAAPSSREDWVQAALKSSTARLAEPKIQAAVLAEIMRVFGTMEYGREADHLRELVRHVDYRGSDVRLRTGEILEGSRQVCPYPACAWNWETTQAYKWANKHHINIFEFVAFFNYVRAKSETVNNHSKKFSMSSTAVSSLVWWQKDGRAQNS